MTIIGQSADAPARFTEVEGSTATYQGQTVRIKLGAERIFGGSLSDTEFPRIEQALAAGRVPVISYKPWLSDGNWLLSAAELQQVKALLARVNAYGEEHDADIPVCLHHEFLKKGPTRGTVVGEGGTYQQWVAMNRAVIAAKKAAGWDRVKLGPIGNGWIVKPTNAPGMAGIGEAAMDRWFPQDLIDSWDWIGCDFYENDENKPGDQMRRWREHFQTRRPGVRLLVGEVGTRESSSGVDELRRVQAEILDNLDAWWVVCWFNSARNTRDGENWRLDPASPRMTAFVLLAHLVQQASDPDPDPPPPPVDAPADLARIVAAQTALDGPGTALARIVAAITALTTTEGA